MSPRTWSLVLLLAPVSALADEAADIAAARAFGTEGVVLAEQGKCAQAIDKLTRAEKLHHAPTTAVRLAECEIEVGKLVAGTERLQRLLRDPVPARPPAAFVNAMARAERVLAAAAPRIPMLHITVKAPPDTKFTLSVDGEPISEVFLDNDRPTDPGPHSIEVSAPGHLADSASVTLKERDVEKVQLTLAVDPAAKKEPEPTQTTSRTEPAPAAAVSQTSPPAEAGVGSGQRTVAWVVGGVGLAGVAVGAVAGVKAMGDAATLKQNCPDKVCAPDQAATLTSAKTWSTVSTVGFIAGGVGLGAALVLWLTAPSQAPVAHTVVSVHPVIGVASVGLEGSF